MTNEQALLWVIGIVVITGMAIYFGRAEIVAVLHMADMSVMALLLSLQLFTLFLRSFQWQLLFNKNENKLSIARILTIKPAGFCRALRRLRSFVF